MKTQAIIVFIYGLLILVGGIMGHLKANSAPSLIAGIVFAALSIASAIVMFKGIEWGHTAALIISSFLALFFMYRFSLSYKFMPAGLMIILSLMVIGCLIFMRKKIALS
jgi:uncharacterized membrane protein (UPF0136 family)